jgi:hypothetical protein
VSPKKEQVNSKVFSKEFNSIFTLFGSNEVLTKTQKRSIREQPLMFPISNLDPTNMNKKNSFNPPRVSAAVPRIVTKIFSKLLPKNAKILLHELSFPFGMIVDSFKKIRSIESLQISINPKFLGEWVTEQEWVVFWDSSIVKKSKTSLKKLILSDIGLSFPFNSAIFSSLSQLSNLAQLDLSGNQMGTQAIRRSGSCLGECKGLLSLDVSANCLQNKGVAVILDAVEGLEKLQDLNISLNGVDAEG